MCVTDTHTQRARETDREIPCDSTWVEIRSVVCNHLNMGSRAHTHGLRLASWVPLPAKPFAGPELFIYLKATVSYVAQVGLLPSSCHPTAWVSRVLGLQIYTWHQVPEHLSFLEEDPWVAEWLKGWGTRGLMKEALLVNSNYVMQNVSIL